MKFWAHSDQLSVDVSFEADSLAHASETIGRLIDAKAVVSFENRNFGGMSYVTVVNWGLVVDATVSFERFFDEGKPAVEAQDDLLAGLEDAES